MTDRWTCPKCGHGISEWTDGTTTDIWCPTCGGESAEARCRRSARMHGPAVDHEVLDIIGDRLRRRTDEWQASREDDRVEFTDPDSGQRYEIVVRAILTDHAEPKR
jgi:uncharacterized Zn finger protein (UPF0148 family)